MKGLILPIVFGIARALLPYLAGKGIDVSNEQANQVIEAGVVISAVVGTIANKVIADRKLREAKAGY